MGQQSYSIDELVKKVERGEIRLPEMQRQYVWKAPRIRDLLDSLYRGYPSGTILTWETDEPVPTRAFAVEQEESAVSSYQLLLDGQQRLTSLSAILRGEPITVKNRKRPIEILFNLEHPDQLSIVTEVDEVSNSDKDTDEEDASEDEIQKRLEKMAFVMSTKRLAQIPHWVSVTEIFKSTSDAPFLKKAGATSLDDPLYEKYTSRLSKLRSIKDYKYNVEVLERSKSYEEVTEIFVRVNSLGAKLRGSDLALAQITAKWRDSLAIFEAFQNQCRNEGFDFDIGIYIKTLIAFATGQSRFKVVPGLKLEALQSAWEEAKTGFTFAMNFLRSNIGIDSTAILSSPFLIPTIAYYAHHKEYKLTPEDEKKLRTWFLIANAKGRYSRGSSEGYLDQDLGAIRKGRGIDVMMDYLKTQFGRLDIIPTDLENRNSRSAYFKTMFLAFRKDGAKDWFESLAISTKHVGSQSKLQFHHIFPQDVLKKAGVDKELINDISNLAFIGGKTNRKISNKAPVDYLPDIVSQQGEAALSSQQIPTNPELWDIARYQDFLEYRRYKITDRLNEFINQ